MLPDFSFEIEASKKGHKIIAGLDEVGRGAFAGPVIAAAVVFAPNYKLQILNSELQLNDSKKLSSKQREQANEWICENCLAYGIGSAGVAQINKFGIKKATEIAFRKAIRNTNKILKNKRHPILVSKYLSIEYLLVDAFNIPHVPKLPRHKQNAIVKGDTLSISIASASIIAKVYRDRFMTELGKNAKYKKYNWHKNKGYGTMAHRKAILEHGSTELHRKAFVNTWISRKYNK